MGNTTKPDLDEVFTLYGQDLDEWLRSWLRLRQGSFWNRMCVTIEGWRTTDRNDTTLSLEVISGGLRTPTKD